MSTLTTERALFQAALLALLAGMDSGAGGGAGMGTINPTRTTAINYVKAKLDELIPTGEGISFALSATPNITNPLDLLINAHLDESTKDVLLSAPLSVLVPKDGADSTVATNVDGVTGFISLPDDFLRLSVLKMNSWLTDVTNPITIYHKDYRKQSIPSLRGGIAKPVAVLSWYASVPKNIRILEFYSVVSTNGLASVDRFLYIPETLAEDFITINPNLLDSLAWMCAGKIMQITGMFDAAKLAQERVKQSYNNL